MNLQARVPRALRKRYHDAAAKAGMSLSLYLEWLINLDPQAPPASSDEPASIQETLLAG